MTTPFWNMILPREGTNYLPNPSFERGTLGMGTLGGGTVNRMAGTAVFGAWAACGTTAAANQGIAAGTLDLAAGSYTISAWVYAGSGSQYNFGVYGTNGAQVTTTTITGVGSYQRVGFSYGEAAPTRRFIGLVRTSAGNDPFWLDGVQVEAGTFQTTYIDGDQDGCTWQGLPHLSPSYRSGTSRQGGTIVSLQSLGLTVLEQSGVGMPQVSNITQDYAIADGALWQRQRANARSFTLTSFMSGTTWAGLHAIRSTIVNAVKIDASPNPQPVRFLYIGQGGTQTIDAYYDGGLEMQGRDGFTETAGLNFLAPDPYWYAVTDRGTALRPQQNLGSFNNLLQRDAQGRWGTMGPNGTGINNGVVFTMALNAGGTLFVGGNFTAADGTASGGMAMWMPGGSWGTTSGGTVPVTVYSLALNPAGTVFVGGAFTTVAGTTTRGLAAYTGAWGTLSNGAGVSGGAAEVRALTYAQGSLFFGGGFSNIGGTAGTNVGYWANGTFGTTGVALNGSVFALAVPGDGWVYVGGNFTQVNTLARSGFFRMQSLTAVTGTVGPAVTVLYGAASPTVSAVTVGLDGLLYIGGAFGTAGAVTGTGYGSIAAFTGGGYQRMGSGIWPDASQVTGLNVDPRTGDILIAGVFTGIGGVTSVAPGAARWNNNTYYHYDFTYPANSPRAILAAPDGRLFVGGDFNGTAITSAVTTVVNDGAANAYPVLVARNLGTSSANVWQLLNTTTNDNIWLNLLLQAGETFVMDLRTGKKSLTTDYQGNVIGAVRTGSNLTTWRLAPGTNTVSFYASSGSVEASLYWRNRAWSADPRR